MITTGINVTDHQINNGHKPFGADIFNYNTLRQDAMILRAVNHDMRKSMLELLSKNHKMTVTEIYVNLRLEQSVASQHLAILRNAGVLKTERDGKYIYYSVNQKQISKISRLTEELVSA